MTDHLRDENEACSTPSDSAALAARGAPRGAFEPGALPPDGTTLARDRASCTICGRVQALLPGSDVCRECDRLSRAAAEAAVTARARQALCGTSGLEAEVGELKGRSRRRLPAGGKP